MHSDPSTTNSTEPSLQTPSTGLLSTDSDQLFESRGAAISVVVTLSIVVVILFTTNVLTAWYLFTRVPVFRRKTIPNATDAVLQLQAKGGIGAANRSFTEETIIANKGAGMNYGIHMEMQFNLTPFVVLLILLNAWFKHPLSMSCAEEYTRVELLKIVNDIPDSYLIRKLCDCVKIIRVYRQV